MDGAAEPDFDAYVRASGPRLKRVRDYQDPDAYLRKVMVNQRTSWWRRDRGRETLGPVPIKATAGDLADDQAELDVLLQALRALPDRQRSAVVLRHYCDLSEAETAAVMGITVGGVKSQTSKGLVALRAALVPGGTTGSQKEATR